MKRIPINEYGFWFDADSCKKYHLNPSWSRDPNFYPKEIINTRKGNWILTYDKEKDSDLPSFSKTIDLKTAQEMLNRYSYAPVLLDDVKIDPGKEI